MSTPNHPACIRGQACSILASSSAESMGAEESDEFSDASSSLDLGECFPQLSSLNKQVWKDAARVSNLPEQQSTAESLSPATSTGTGRRWKSFKISSFLPQRFQRVASSHGNRLQNSDPGSMSQRLSGHVDRGSRNSDVGSISARLTGDPDLGSISQRLRDYEVPHDGWTGEKKSYMVPYDSPDDYSPTPRNVISIRGLIKLCGRDARGKPIVVIDTSYCPPAYMRFAALGHIREKMEPIVEAGEYNLVFVMSPSPSNGDNHREVPTMWCLEVYHKLPYVYKKNVRRVVFIHPTFVVNLVLNLLRPFMSSKAHEKIVRVHSLGELDKATEGDITLDKLYLASRVYLHDKFISQASQSEAILLFPSR